MLQAGCYLGVVLFTYCRYTESCKQTDGSNQTICKMRSKPACTDIYKVFVNGDGEFCLTCKEMNEHIKCDKPKSIFLKYIKSSNVFH
ncbi:hypothetical protein PHET_04921 [Paragonimus heterotremus]|uniref:Uncharacterized protein n=1 Tax=Paragonimus heterotremus TaxID=100268 RepID=A0A8J4T0U5_9TREM|nr:hypothetical protein PHET_04921 [Paragonimus heterotremus]